MKKIILFLLLIGIVILSLYLQGHFRIWIVNTTMHSTIPGWLKMILWGWM